MRMIIVTNNPLVREYAQKMGHELQFVADDGYKVLIFGRNMLVVGWRLVTDCLPISQNCDNPFVSLVLEEGQKNRLFLQDILRLEQGIRLLEEQETQVGAHLAAAREQDYRRACAALEEVYQIARSRSS